MSAAASRISLRGKQSYARSSERGRAVEREVGRPLPSQAPARARLPREAREGLMRVWLQILSERHPDVRWLPAQHTAAEE